MLSLFSILKCSGGHWCRAALAWLAFAALLQGLALAGTEVADAEGPAHQRIGLAPGASSLGGQTRTLPGKLQVAVVSVSAFDPTAFDAHQFGDSDDLGSGR